MAAASGVRRLRLCLAGFGIGFESYSPGIIPILRRRYGRFSSRNGRSLSFSVSEAEGRPNPFKPSVRVAGGRLAISRGDFNASLDLKTGTGELSAAPGEQCLDAFLRSLISSLLLHSGGLMLHSAGLVKNGRAYLFLGKSGAGKSTLSRLAAGTGQAEVLSDEMNMLRREKGRFYVYGSPFWGEMRADGRPGRWPLGGVYLLRKARAHAVTACGKGEALKLLLRCLLNFEKGPDTAGLALANTGALLGKTAFRRLEFSKKDGSFLGLLV